MNVERVNGHTRTWHVCACVESCNVWHIWCARRVGLFRQYLSLRWWMYYSLN